MQGKFPVFGIPFSTLPRGDLRAAVRECERRTKGAAVLFANAHVLVEASRNPALAALMKKADFVVPDGVPVAWVMKAKGQNTTQRYSGPDFMVDFFRETRDARHFFLGSTEETLAKIKSKFDGAAAGFYSPPFSQSGFSEDEFQRQLKIVKESRADFIWVGLGAPKQERHAVEMAARAGFGVWLAVGAAFDFYAGNKPRAPRILQAMGMEWAFRLASEPRRLTKRYLDTNPAFIKMALKEIWGRDGGSR